MACGHCEALDEVAAAFGRRAEELTASQSWLGLRARRIALKAAELKQAILAFEDLAGGARDGERVQET